MCELCEDTFREEPRVLSNREKSNVAEIKTTAKVLLNTFQAYVPEGREASLAKTKLEEAVMWAVKGVTG